ncbi:MAG: hypothetical protein HN742_04060 [Lentisphaerae bacterium]|jgi:hypothetical protein|nr:hypothetical protein [Lentisphaerota bacterium]MBT4822181.1 hypothetical protein [Lentisphaerota bacterium]MBT5604860.1 hypothetical protein [Lentisphaerota bacterium]MBT7054221.1 hypothetical protein [Lentisphaerota bacterium]MBT7841018.1 hypothetical protein [Lentisphaerota bacterium]
MEAQPAPPSARDIALVRELASQAMEYATSDECETRRQRWRDVNELRRPDRAPVWCRIALAWREILSDDDIQCIHPTCRAMETALRKDLFYLTLGIDHIWPPWWPIRAGFRCTTGNMWGVPGRKSIGTTDWGGFLYDHPIKDPADYEKVTVPDFEYDAVGTARRAEQAAEILGDAMPVRVEGVPPTYGLLQVYWEHLRGMAPMMEDLAFRPDVCHRLMAKLTEGALRGIRRAEEAGVLTSNHHEPMFCSDPVNGATEDGNVALHQMWTGANSQEFDQVGPAMFEEFLLNYQKVVLSPFGHSWYGCCENLTTKIHQVLSIPNLRVFVSSFWTDLDKVIEAVGNDFCIMWRQSAAQVTLHDDLSDHEAHLERGLKNLRGHHYQVVLREIETVKHNPERLRDWAKLAIRIAEKYA